MIAAHDDPALSLFGCTLILRDNEWSACAIDDLKADWRELTEQGTRGFCQLSAGRHQVVTIVDDCPVALDVTLYPGETLVRRLDPEAKRWILEDRETEQNFLDLAVGGRFGSMASALVDYGRASFIATRTPPAILSVEAARQAGEAFLLLAERLGAGEPAPEILSAGYAIGVGLVGKPPLRSQLDKLVGLLSSTATQAAAAERFALAGQLTLLALSILPGEPWLLDLMANLYADAGHPDLALPLIEEALRRAELYPAPIQERMRATLAEVTAAREGAASN